MIQDKDFFLRQIKEITDLLNRMIGLGPARTDIEQQIYTATGFTGEDYTSFSDERLEETINQKGIDGRQLFLEFLGNLFYHQYQQTQDKALLYKAQKMYFLFQNESGIFSIEYFDRMQEK